MTQFHLAQLQRDFRTAANQSTRGLPPHGNLSTAALARKYGVTVEDIRRARREWKSTSEVNQ